MPFRDLELLLVEDDDADAIIVEELLVDTGERYTMERARSLAEAVPLASGSRCALVDLGLPDADGLDALTRLRRAAPDLAIVVLTGIADRARGIEAVAAGAQDYLVKGEIDGLDLVKAIRFAIGRLRAEEDRQRLLLAERKQEENERLARGLLPILHVDGPHLRALTRYRPGTDASLGGDFYDAVAVDGVVRAVIGDVCGHGPAEAALGVALRIAWRTMVLAGASPADTLAAVRSVLVTERDETLPFVTVCDVTLEPAERRLEVRRHGHPAPLVVTPAVGWLDAAPTSPPLGCFEHVEAEASIVELPENWSLLLLTDGVYEGRAGDGRLGQEGLLRVTADLAASNTEPDHLLDALLEAVETLHGGALDDDAALVWLGSPR